MEGNLVPLEEEEWYGALIEECIAIHTEYGFLSRWSLVEGYHKLGSRILEENDHFERSKIYGKDVVNKVARSVGLSPRTIQYAVQFAKKFPQLNLLPTGKNTTWTRITEELLPENPLPIEKKKHKCPQCGFLFP
jgi:hypothetical protein